MGGFTHLHLHTQYSLLDGAIRVKDLFKKTTELGMDTVAVTDHVNVNDAAGVNAPSAAWANRRSASIKPSGLGDGGPGRHRRHPSDAEPIPTFHVKRRDRGVTPHAANAARQTPAPRGATLRGL